MVDEDKDVILTARWVSSLMCATSASTTGRS